MAKRILEEAHFQEMGCRGSRWTVLGRRPCAARGTRFDPRGLHWKKLANYRVKKMSNSGSFSVPCRKRQEKEMKRRVNATAACSASQLEMIPFPSSKIPPKRIVAVALKKI